MDTGTVGAIVAAAAAVFIKCPFRGHPVNLGEENKGEKRC